MVRLNSLTTPILLNNILLNNILLNNIPLLVLHKVKEPRSVERWGHFIWAQMASVSIQMPKPKEAEKVQRAR